MRIANALRDEYNDRPRTFSHDGDYRPALAERLECMRESAFAGFVDNIADAVDKARHAAAAPGRQPCLPGCEFALAGELRLGDDTRIAQRHARLHHAETALAIDNENLAAVQQANLRKREELERLRPYWWLNMTKQQAVAAYQEANPNPDVA
jgi:hypothetical protein